MPGDRDPGGRVAGENFGAAQLLGPRAVPHQPLTRPDRGVHGLSQQCVREREGEGGVVVGEDPLTDGLGDRVGERVIIGARVTRVVTVVW